MRTIAATRYKVRGPELERAIKIPAREKEALEYLAPYAADYAPMVLQYAKPVMAGLFVGIWGMSVAVRLKALGDLERAEKATHTDTEPVNS